MSYEDRAAGAIVGAFVGDALGAGCHWYYDLGELRATYGAWIDDYVTPRSGHYHDMLEAGQFSQTGQVQLALLESVAERGRHDPEDFLSRLDGLFETLDGTSFSGRYTNGYICDLYAARQAGRGWGDPATPSWSDTSEAAMRSAILAARYGGEQRAAGREILRNVRLTHQDPLVVAQSTAFGLVLRELISGRLLTPSVASHTRGLAKGQDALAHDPGAQGLAPPPTLELPLIDSVLQPAYVIGSAQDPHTRLEEPWRIAGVYGLACAIHFLIPAAYYLAGCFPGEFEAPVLHAINGGGNNMARACLTGALAGAQVGLSGIPERFLERLEEGPRIVDLARATAAAGVGT
jgi:ADP-ribosyl-[dinitrogen reductase] hydrolase